jgi:hypothetical protein
MPNSDDDEYGNRNNKIYATEQGDRTQYERKKYNNIILQTNIPTIFPNGWTGSAKMTIPWVPYIYKVGTHRYTLIDRTVVKWPNSNPHSRIMKGTHHSPVLFTGTMKLDQIFANTTDNEYLY